MIRSRSAAAVVVLAAALASCRPFRPVSAPSAGIRSIEGYASLRLTRDGETARSKFAFLILLPDQARLEVFDALGRAVSEFVLRGNKAWLVLPSKKAYWAGRRDEVVEKFLGAPVRPEEIAGLLTGRWPPEIFPDWTFERDASGRAVSGDRGDLSFRVQEFRPRESLPRRLVFRAGPTEGTLGLLEADFNRPNPGLSMDFLRTCESRTWAEIEGLLR